MKIEEKLELFKDSAIEEASVQSTSMLDTYKGTLEAMYESRIEAAKAKAEDFIKSETDRLNREHNKTLSIEMNNIKRDMGEKHHQVKEQIFADVVKKLVEYTATPEYKQQLIHFILAAKKTAKDNPITIYVDPVDTDKVADLESAAGMKITVSTMPFIGGMRAVIGNRNILIDHSYASRLSEARESFTI